MEANGIRKRIEAACFNNTFIKLIFQYPASPRAIIKRGYVKDIFEDCFNFEEIRDGLVTYSYEYIIEIMEADIDKPIK